jgi:hypothetical protein
VQNKLELLKEMRRVGVWLVDASVSAIYPHLRKLATGDYCAVLKACWESHIGEVLCGCAPSAVLIVGKRVDSAIAHGAISDDAKLALDLVNVWRRQIVGKPCRAAPPHERL